MKMKWTVFGLGPRTALAASFLWVMSFAFSDGGIFAGKVQSSWTALLSAWREWSAGSEWIDAGEGLLPSFFPSRDCLFFILFSWFALEAVFWFFNGILIALYAADAFPQYRIERRESESFDWPLFRECLADVCIGHFLIRPLALPILYVFFQKFCVPFDDPLPSFGRVCVQMFWCMWIDDTYFYFAHRLCHSVPWLYKNIHKQHHRFRKPVGISVEYAHPVEDIFVNTVGTVLGPLILGCHYCSFILYTLLKLWQSIEAHSNYSFPFPFSFWSFVESFDCARAHDFHHSHNVGNFGGTTMFWDWLLGTDAAYNKWQRKKLNTNKML